VHIRLSDFLDVGWVKDKSVARFLPAVQQIQQQIGTVLPVIVGTDNEDDAIFAEMKSYGWLPLNHTRFGTVERFSDYHPAVLDMIVLGRARGFVGTGRSTYSYLAQKRVESWQGGPTIIL
jgi:hypothetical protein